jgi:protein-L-isoaspartate O-methyltransferase
MEAVDRAHFVTDTGKSAAYTDSPQLGLCICRQNIFLNEDSGQLATAQP